MRIWVDADSCPRQVRKIIIRASKRTRIPAVFVANRDLPEDETDTVTKVQVSSEADEADTFILKQAKSGDIVVSRDIPLAAQLAAQDILVLNDRGTVFTKENVRERLSIRDFMKELRESNLFAQKNASFNNRQAKAFANAFDTELRKLISKG